MRKPGRPRVWRPAKEVGGFRTGMRVRFNDYCPYAGRLGTVLAVSTSVAPHARVLIDGDSGYAGGWHVSFLSPVLALPAPSPKKRMFAW